MSKNINQSKNQTYKLYLLLFGFFLLLNCVTTGGHLFSIDDVQYFLHTENLALHHSITLDPSTPSASKLASQETYKQIQQKFYSYQGKEWNADTQLIPWYDGASLLLPFLAIPLYYVSMLIHVEPITLLPFFMNSIIISLVSMLIFITSRHFFKSSKIAFVLSLVYMVTTFVWPYNTGMMLRPLSSLMIMVGFYFTVNSKFNCYRSLVSGICIGLSLLSEASAIILLPGFVAFGIIKLRQHKKSLLFFMSGFTFITSIQAILNQIRFGSIIDFGFGVQQDISTHSHIDGVIGYIFSLGWGIPFNAPLLVLFPIAVFLILKKNRILGMLLSYIFLITWIFHGTEISPLWSGYGGWGPRYFNIILPMMILSLGFVFSEYDKSKIFKITFIILSSIGFFVNLIGKIIWYWYGYAYGWAILKTATLSNWWEHLNYDISYVPITLNLLTLDSHYLQSISSGFGLGLAPCPYDLFIYCKIGIPVFSVILASLVLVGFLLLRTLYKHSEDIKI